MDEPVTTQTQAEIASLVQLLEHQRSLYRRLRLLAERQRTLVMMDDHQPLLELLAERQRLVNALASLVTKMSPYRSRWPQLYQQMEEPTRKSVTSLLEEVNASLSSILSSDHQDTATLQARRETTSHQLSLLTTAGRVGAAYAAAGASVRTAVAEAHG